MGSVLDGSSRLAGYAAGAAFLLALAAVSLPVRAALFHDATGREVEIPAPPRRIVSMAPNLTEILFALDLDREIAGVTLFCDWPPAARDKPKIGGFINPSLESIVALEPDLVLATADGNRRTDVLNLEVLGLTVYVADSRSLDDILGTIADIGLLTGRAKEAERLVQEMDRRRDRIRRAVEQSPAPTVFVALDRNPLITAGRGTFIDELVQLAGGRNIVDSLSLKYPLYSLEQLLAANPEVIVSATGPGEDNGNEASRWREMPGGGGLAAVEKGRVYEVGDGDFFRPGPRIMETLERLAVMFHPESFP